MIISNLLDKYLPDYYYEIINEKDFSTFGLVNSQTFSSRCSFIDREEFIGEIPEEVTMVITKKELIDKIDDKNRGFCIVDEPRIVFFRLHNALSKQEPYARKRLKTVIGDNCNISPSAIISEENVIIGDNVTIEEFVVIRDNVVIGDNTKIRTGVKIGCPDFEFKRENNEVFGVEHCGGVIIGENVEILSNTGVNKALYPWDNTIIEDYVKIDMLVNISHGVKIGAETMIVALSGIGGRTIVGNRCWIGYGAIIRNGIKIGNNARVNMGAIVSRNVEDNQSVTGNFAIDHEKFMTDLKNRAK